MQGIFLNREQRRSFISLSIYSTVFGACTSFFFKPLSLLVEHNWGLTSTLHKPLVQSVNEGLALTTGSRAP